MSYGLVLTNAGAAEIETAYHAGKTVEIVKVALGDGGGAALPDTSTELAKTTSLAGQFGSEGFSGAKTDEGIISGRVIIPCATYPDKTLREVGMISASGTLIAYGIYPETYIPDEGAAVLKEITITMVLTLTHAESVSIAVDPYIAIVTQDSGDARYLQRQNNLADVGDTAEARKNIGLEKVGNWAAYPMSGGYLNDECSISLISEEKAPVAGEWVYSPMYRVVLRGRGAQDFSDGASAFMRIVEQVGTQAYLQIQWDGFGSVHEFRFTQNGDLVINGRMYTGGGSSYLGADGNIYGPAWGGYLDQWVLAQINALNVALNNQISASINVNNNDWVQANFQLKNSANLGSGWEKDSTTGRIRQWGFLHAGATTGYFQVNFPITFPNTCANVQVTVVNGGGSKFADNFATAGNVTPSGFTCGQDTGGSYWEAIGW